MRGKGIKYRINKERLITLIIVVALIFSVAVSVKKIIILKEEKNHLKETNQSLKKEKEKLDEEFKNVNDSNYIEEQARIQLKLIKPGETLFILDEDSSKDKDDSPKDKNGESKENQ